MPDDKLARHLADMARDIQSQADVSAATDRIVEAAAALIGGDGSAAGITLVHRQRRVETPAATSDAVRRGDTLQYELGEGPCLDAAWVQELVYSNDLPGDHRWPKWGPQVAEELGVRSMLCTQLFTNENQLGALNVYSPHLDAFDTNARETAVLLAAHAAVAVAAAQQVDTLKVAVDHRTTIGKALGIVMVLYDLDDQLAFEVLRRLSGQQNRKLYDLAQEVVLNRQLPRG